MNASPRAGPRLTIWLTQTGEPLPLVPGARHYRAAMLAGVLAARGHDVTWWASAFSHFRKAWTFPSDTTSWTDTGVRIRALRGVGYTRNISPRRLLDYRLVARKFRDQAPHEPRPDVIVTAMPGYDMVGEAVRYGWAHDVPVMVDVRDQWPEIFADPLPPLLQPLGRAALWGETRIMRRGLAGARAIVSMSDALLDWAVGQAGRERSVDDRVFYPGSHAMPSSAAVPSARLAKALDRAAGRLIITFAGTFGRVCSPLLLVEAARRMRGDNVHFILAGEGDHLPAVEKAAAGLDNVDLPGWLNESDLGVLLLRSSIGVSPALSGSDRPFFPNKIFGYLAAGLPIVSAFPGEVQRVIEEAGVGCHYSGLDGLVEVLRRLVADGDTRARMSAAGRRLFSERFDAACIYADYADHVEHVAAAGAAAGRARAGS